jgi:hypothetical protein
VWGSGSHDTVTDTTLVVSASDSMQVTPASAGGGGYPALEKVIAHSTVIEDATLQGHVARELAQSSRPVELPEVSVRADMDPELGTYIVGDAARLIIPPGKVPLFPAGRDTFRRIVSRTVTVSNEGTEAVRLALAAVSEATLPRTLTSELREMRRQLADLR